MGQVMGSPSFATTLSKIPMGTAADLQIDTM